MEVATILVGFMEVEMAMMKAATKGLQFFSQWYSLGLQILQVIVENCNEVVISDGERMQILQADCDLLIGDKGWTECRIVHRGLVENGSKG